MKKEIIVISMMMLFLTCFAAANASDKKLSDDDKVKNLNIYGELENKEYVEVLVKLKSIEQKSNQMFYESFSENNLKQHFNKEFVSMTITINELEKLKQDDNIEEIDLERYFQTTLLESTLLINATDVWSMKEDNFNLTGQGQTICIIDTGINYTHPDLGGCFGQNNESSTCKIKGGIDWCSDNSDCATFDQLPDDINGHGTHVAGIASANGSIKGVALDSSIIMFKAANASGSFRASDVNDGIQYCINYSTMLNISAISMSLGGGSYSTFCDEEDLDLSSTNIMQSINEAVRKNISVVVATGNNGQSNGVSFPACITNATRVAASDKGDNFWSTSNRNPTVLIIAPGASINSTSTDLVYETLSGTSMATPHVSGAIAIIKQYLALTNQNKTPYQIEDILNDSGKPIYDSSSGRNYSRINLKAALISLDIDPSNITLVSPVDGYLSSNGSLTFRCNATDLSIRNVSFYLWNSTNSVVNLTRQNLSGQGSQYEINVSIASSGTYNWNCLFGDENGNTAFAASNKTVILGDVILSLTSPSNNTYSNISNTNFTCSAQTAPTSNLTNMTFYLWNSTNSLIYNRTQNATGSVNSSIFNYTFTGQSAYKWNCIAINNQSNISVLGSNYTFTYDSTKPALTIISPDDDYAATSSLVNIDFSFNVSDNFNISSCTFTLNGQNETNNSIINIANITQKFTASLTPASYSWYITCFDLASNSNASIARNIIISAPSTSSGGGGGGGGGGGSAVVAIKETQLEEGFNKAVKKGEKYKFNLSNQQHNLIIGAISNNSVNLTIRSTEINLTLIIGETKKLSLNGNNTYDLSITLLSINKSNANLLIKKVYEKIKVDGDDPILHTFENETVNVANNTVSEVESNESESNNLVYIILTALIIAGLIIFIFSKYKGNKEVHPHTDKIHRIKYNVNKDIY